MSKAIDNINTALELCEKYKDTFVTIRPQTTESISKAEAKLNVKFPDSYKKFLYKYGTDGPVGIDIYGVYDENGNGYVVDNTLDAREEEIFESNGVNFLYEYVVICGDGSGGYFVLDTSRMNKNNECPVVYLDSDNSYFPDDYSDDFGTFLLNKINIMSQDE